ncbi:MAG: transporter substrate-binding domain-containing protein [Parachlamydiales bacterium]|nr:transporter substrate-binding domain-containing protein [Parachlamydiales bacterium]
MRFLNRMLCFLVITLLITGCSSQPPTNKFDNSYRIARDREWTSLDLYGKEMYVLAFSDELLTLIADEEKMSLELIKTNWDFLIQGLEQGNFSAIVTSQEPVGRYADQLVFSEVFLQLGSVLVVAQDSNATDIAQMQGKIVTIPQGQEGVTFSNDYPDLITYSYLSIPEALQDVYIGKADGAMIPSIIAFSYCRDIYHGSLKVVTKPMDSLGLRLVAMKKNKFIIDQFNSGLTSLEKSGMYQDLLTKWKLN